MKRPGRVLGNWLATVLTVFALHALADTQLAGRDFDHMVTGFPLSGGHATAACETCHIGGVFKGTPKNCDGCHALGKRVVATPKPTSHIVTDAPCESCHFNTYTFLGARYNHGTAVPGQCVTCHNGRITTGRPANHNAGLRATASCDSCHRSYAFLPASWNHIGVVPHSCDGVGCHVAGSNQYYKPANHQTTPYLDRNTFYCDECHNVTSWLPGLFIHDRPATLGVCMGCHDGSSAPGKPAGHITTTSDCNGCHSSTVTWLGASLHTGAIAGICGTCHDGSTAKGTSSAPSPGHIPVTASGNACDNCHTSTTTFSAWIVGATQHTLNNNNGACNPCHSTNYAPAYSGITTRITLGNHNGSTTSQDCVNCHHVPYSWSD